jgi:hypothetical protein
VQGYPLIGSDLAQIGLPDGESAVEIPSSLLDMIVRADGG